MNNYIFNIFGFYSCWWLGLYGAYSNLFYLGPLALLIFLLLHFYKVVNHPNEYKYLIICLFLGLIIDTMNIRLGLISYKGIIPLKYGISPLWAISLWVCFGATVFHSFKWLHKKYIMSSILGFLTSPIIYISANKLGVVTFNQNYLYVLIIVSFIWAFFIPLYVYIADKLLEE